jgi:hypothetical protein
MTKSEMLDYFNEHVYYELRMLIFASQRLEQEDNKLVWNAMFAAFNVSARNLENYLTNKGNNTRVRVLDYAPYRKNACSISNEPIRTILDKLNAQCLHMGKKRSEKTDEKLNLDRGRKISAWVV